VSLWLDPVIQRLGEINNSFATAKDKIAQGQAGAPGWVGGEGHGAVRDASVSFFGQVSASLQFLRIDQGQVIEKGSCAVLSQIAEAVLTTVRGQ